MSEDPAFALARHVTATGHEVLTAGAPTDPDAIEKLMAAA